MLFALIAHDKPGHEHMRIENRSAHLDFAMGEDSPVRIAGPLMSDDGRQMIGSILIFEAESLDAAKQWAELDPYARAGLFASVDIRPWKWVIGKPEDRT